MPLKINLSQSSLTLGDMEDFEELTGQSLGRVVEVAATADADSMLASLPIKTITGLIWITGRKADPSLTLEQVRSMPIEDLESLEIFVGDDEAEVDPTPASV